MSKRDSIIENIKTELAKITTTAGYNYTVGLIGENLVNPEDLTADQFPALIVLDSDETKNDASVDELRNEMMPLIVGYLKPTVWADNKKEVRKLLADVEKCLCADRNRGTLAINTLPASIKTDHGFNQPFGIFEFQFKISYLQEYGTP